MIHWLEELNTVLFDWLLKEMWPRGICRIIQEVRHPFGSLSGGQTTWWMWNKISTTIMSRRPIYQSSFCDAVFSGNSIGQKSISWCGTPVNRSSAHDLTEQEIMTGRLLQRQQYSKRSSDEVLIRNEATPLSPLLQWLGAKLTWLDMMLWWNKNGRFSQKDNKVCKNSHGGSFITPKKINRELLSEVRVALPETSLPSTRVSLRKRVSVKRDSDLA